MQTSGDQRREIAASHSTVVVRLVRNCALGRTIQNEAAKQSRRQQQKVSARRRVLRNRFVLSQAMVWRERGNIPEMSMTEVTKPQRTNPRKRARNDRNRTNASLASQGEHFRATHRQTAVEIATGARQCTVALRSNFCRHMYRTVNTQASVLAFAQRRLQTAL
jgi:hypothetical protein